MTALLPQLDGIDTVICDIDGVVVLGSEPVPGAGTSLARLRTAGLRVVFVTNNSTKTTEVIAQRINDLVGFEPNPADIVSSGAATAAFIAPDVGCVYVVGTDGLRSTLRRAGIRVTDDWHEADAVVTGLDFNLSYDALVGATLAVQNGATFYATNIDVTYPTPEGLYPGAGALAAVVEKATGIAPVICGKPHRPMRAMLEGLGVARPLVIGDRPDTDIALGKLEDWPTVLVLTGVTPTADEIPAAYRPDLVIDSIADLPSTMGL